MREIAETCAPPSSSSTVIPSSPSSPSSGQRSRGNSLLASIASARGAIRSAANPSDGFAQQVDILSEAKIKIEHGGVSRKDCRQIVVYRARGLNTMLAVVRQSVSIKSEKSSYWEVIPSFANRLRLCTMTVPGAMSSSRAIDLVE